jgi:hypothetical protein
MPTSGYGRSAADEAKSRSAMTFTIGAMQHFPTQPETDAALDAIWRNSKRAYVLPLLKKPGLAEKRPIPDHRSATP